MQESYPDWHFTEIGIDKDHVHVPMMIPPKYSVSCAVETIKKGTSRALRERFQFLDQVYWDRVGIWSQDYVVSTVGITEEIIRRYVARQEKEDAGQRSLNSEIPPPVKAGESIDHPSAPISRLVSSMNSLVRPQAG